MNSLVVLNRLSPIVRNRQRSLLGNHRADESRGYLTYNQTKLAHSNSKIYENYIFSFFIIDRKKEKRENVMEKFFFILGSEIHTL